MKLLMIKGVIIAVMASGLQAGAKQLSQNYDDHVINKAPDYDDRIMIPKGYKIRVNVTEINLDKSPLKREVSNYKRELKNLNKAVKKMENRFSKHSTKVRETSAHKALRDRVKYAKKLIVKRYNYLCSPALPKLEKLSHQIRNIRKKMELSTDVNKEEAERLVDKYLNLYGELLQPLIDDVFVYYNFPFDGTGDNKLYPARNRIFYNSLNKEVQKAIKKGGVAISSGEADDDDEEDEENTSDKYSKQFTEVTKGFLEEHFSAEPSDRFQQNKNPFRQLRRKYIKDLAKLGEMRDRMTNDLNHKGGRFRETSYYEKQREVAKESGKRICRLFHKLLKKEADQFMKHADQVRRCLKEIAIYEGTPKAKIAEQQYNKHVEAANKYLQKMIDKALGHEPWPRDQEYRVPPKYRSLYDKASKLFYPG